MVQYSYSYVPPKFGHILITYVIIKTSLAFKHQHYRKHYHSLSDICLKMFVTRRLDGRHIHDIVKIKNLSIDISDSYQLS